LLPHFSKADWNCLRLRAWENAFFSWTAALNHQKPATTGAENFAAGRSRFASRFIPSSIFVFAHARGHLLFELPALVKDATERIGSYLIPKCFLNCGTKSRICAT